MGRPPVLILNNVHFFHNDEEGRNMLLQLQQRAEAWAASGKTYNMDVDFDTVTDITGNI